MEDFLLQTGQAAGSIHPGSTILLRGFCCQRNESDSGPCLCVPWSNLFETHARRKSLQATVLAGSSSISIEIKCS